MVRNSLHAEATPSLKSSQPGPIVKSLSSSKAAHVISSLTRAVVWASEDTPSTGTFSTVHLAEVTNTETLKDVLQLITFQDCEALLRATSLATLLLGAGRIFKDSAGSAATYGLSAVVDAIDVFVSHNWSVGRSVKFVALCWHFNFVPAVCAVALFTAILTLISILGWTPTVNMSVVSTGSSAMTYEEGYLCRLLSIPVFLLTLFFYRDIAKYFALEGPRIFLDKVCINQVDDAMMRQGIQRLPAFLRASSSMLILYTDIYWHKLWTVFEVASFLSLHGSDRITVVPIGTAITFLSLIVGTFLYSLALWAAFILTGTYEIVAGVATFAALFSMFMVRQFAKSTAVTKHELQTFSVHNCTCAVEADRPVVYNGIAALMRACEAVPTGTSQDAALDTFDEWVQHDMSAVFFNVIGVRFFKYRHYLMLGMGCSGAELVDFSTALAHGLHWHPWSAKALFILTYFTALWPLLFVTGERLACTRVHLRGWHDKAWLAFVWLVTSFSGLVAASIWRVLYLMAEVELWALWVMVAAWALLSLLAALLCSASCLRRHRQRPSELEGASSHPGCRMTVAVSEASAGGFSQTSTTTLPVFSEATHEGLGDSGPAVHISEALSRELSERSLYSV